MVGYYDSLSLLKSHFNLNINLHIRTLISYESNLSVHILKISIKGANLFIYLNTI